jgi:thioredoxin 1
MSTALIIIGSLLIALFLFNGIRRYQQMKNYKPENESQALIHLTDANFAKQTAHGLILVDCWAPWCGPCKMIAPTLSSLADEYQGKAKIGKLNVDENPKTAAALSIKSIPTLVLFQQGKPVERLTGVKPITAYRKILDKYLG